MSDNGQEQINMQMSRDMGQITADVRTVKHDLQNMKMGIDGMHSQLSALSTQVAQLGDVKGDINIIFTKINRMSESQNKYIGFGAGAGAVITILAGMLAFFVQWLWNHHP